MESFIIHLYSSRGHLSSVQWGIKVRNSSELSHLSLKSTGQIKLSSGLHSLSSGRNGKTGYEA